MCSLCVCVVLLCGVFVVYVSYVGIWIMCRHVCSICMVCMQGMHGVYVLSVYI